MKKGNLYYYFVLPMITAIFVISILLGMVFWLDKDFEQFTDKVYILNEWR